MLWLLGAYVRGLWNSDPRPALSGAGLAVALLTLVAFGCMFGGLWLVRPGSSAAQRWPGGGLLLGAMAVSITLHVMSTHGGGVFFSMVALWALLNMLPLAWGITLTVVTAGLFALVEQVVQDAGFSVGLLAAFYGVALGALSSRQRKTAEEATRLAEATSTVLDERTRLAREIHDILAHSLSAQIVHLEGARLLLSREGDSAKALERVERAQDLARSGLDETRRALATLRGDAPPPDEALAELAEEFHASTGRDCAVEVTGAPHDLPPQAGLAVVRTAQEALTNVRKHAPGARVRVVLRYLDGQVELEVADSGSTEPGLELASSGYGLVGMRERAELIGGTLKAGPAGPGEMGYRVALRIPV